MIKLVIIQRLTASIWTPPNLKPGDVVSVRTEKAARHLIEGGFAEVADRPRNRIALEPLGELKALIERCERRELTHDQLRVEAEALLNQRYTVTVRSRRPDEAAMVVAE